MLIETIPPEVHYGLDSMIWCQEITGDEYKFCCEFDSGFVKFYDSHFEDHANGGTSSFPKRLITRYEAWRDTATREERAVLTYQGFLALKYAMDEEILCVISRLHRINPEPRKAITTKNIKKALKNSDFFRNFEKLCQRANIDFKGSSIEGIKLLDRREKEKKTQRDLRLREEILRQTAESRSTGEYAEQLRLIKLQKSKKNIKKNRKVLRNSLNLLSSICGEETTKIFLQKKEVSISGTNFNFRIQKNKLASISYLGLDISLYDKRDNKLGKLCFYYTNTPAADQLAAFMLDVHAGNEEEIIKISNIRDLTEHSYKNDRLRELCSIGDKPREFLDGALDLGTPLSEAVMSISSHKKIYEKHQRRDRYKKYSYSEFADRTKEKVEKMLMKEFQKRIYNSLTYSLTFLLENSR